MAGEAWWFETSFECAIVWAADIDELPDAEALKDALGSVIHIIVTSALVGSRKESVYVEMELDPLNSATLAARTGSIRLLDSAASEEEEEEEGGAEAAVERLSPWVLHGTVHCVDEDSLVKVLREARRVKKRPGELVGCVSFVCGCVVT